MSDPAERMKLMKADLTTVQVDAMVNAANSSLLGGGGVDGAIHRAAGPELLTECRRIGGCPPGQARITRGYNLPARHVIHTVGPIYRGGRSGEAEVLAACYRAALELAAEQGCRSVAFPAISCGAYGYPIESASGVAVRTVREFLRHHELPETVIFVLFSRSDYEVYARQLGAD